MCPTLSGDGRSVSPDDATSVSPGDLLSLVKPRIVALLCLTGVCASLAAGGLPPVELAAFLVVGVGAAGGSAALNCYYDRDIDPEMERTADRPLAREEFPPWVALLVGLALLAVATVVGLWALPPVAVGFTWAGVASYVGLYTVLLKRRHWLGVVLGGSAGAFPVLAGWTAVRPLAAPAVVMATLVFVWTPAHAWALAVVYRDDFAAAGIPTLPVVADPERTRRAVWVSALTTVATAAALVPFAGDAYGAALLVGTPFFLVAYRRYERAGTDADAVRAFFTSNCYLAVLFVAWAVGGAARPGPVATAAVTAGTLAAFGWLWSSRPSLGGVRAAPTSDPLARLASAYRRVRHDRSPRAE